MSERKVLNKYYPPDFDPSKIPKLREPKNKTFSIRIMAPFNMRCNVCGEYIYKGKKFNSRKENVDDEDFLGLRIFRFYIRCPKCVAEIAFKTDLKNTDYTLEAGATRLFEAEKLAQQMAEEERKEKEAEELNPMKVLENRTKASHKEMAQIDELEELREINARHAKVDTSILLEKQRLYEEHLERLQKEEEDKIIESIFGSKQGQVVKRLAESDSDEDIERTVVKKPAGEVKQSATEILLPTQVTTMDGRTCDSWAKSGKFATKSKLAGLVKKRTQQSNSTSSKMAGVPIPNFAVSDSGTKAAESSTLSSSSVQKAESRLLVADRGTGDKIQQETAHNSSTLALTPGASAALTLLGDYSDSGDSEST